MSTVIYHRWSKHSKHTFCYRAGNVGFTWHACRWGMWKSTTWSEGLSQIVLDLIDKNYKCATVVGRQVYKAWSDSVTQAVCLEILPQKHIAIYIESCRLAQYSSQWFQNTSSYFKKKFNKQRLTLTIHQSLSIFSWIWIASKAVEKIT